MAALGLTIPGSNGAPPLVFTVLGQSLNNMATAFSNDLATASAANNLKIFNLADSTTSGSGTVQLNELISTITQPKSSTYTVPGAGQYTFVDPTAYTTITGSTGGGDTVFATYLSTYNAVGNNNEVNFINGNNVYNGNGTTGDTITGGAGFDVINTGSGNATVFGGYGHDTINLQDTAGNGGDIAYLGDGNNFVNADGANDVVVTGVSGQTINGSTTAAAGANTLTISIESKTNNPNFGGANLINAGTDNTAVFDTIGGNTIFGGSGVLDVIGGVRPGLIVADTITGGTGGGNIYAASDNSFTIANGADTTGANTLNVVAGSGNETLNGGGAAGNLNFFGSADTANGGTTTTTEIGGNGSNFFMMGSGNENITAGAGSNFLVLDLVANSHLTVFDFGASNDLVGFASNLSGEQSSDLANATAGTITGADGTSVNTLTLTLSDNSTVTFVGIDSLAGKIV